MNAYMSAADPVPEVPPLSFPRAALTAVALVIAAFVVITFDAWRQKGERAELEQTSETTAVGDKAWFQPGAMALGLGLSVDSQAPVRFQGEPLYLVGSRRLELRETKMTAIGKDDSGKYTIYTSHEEIPPQVGEKERQGVAVYFLKTGLGEFVKVQPSAPEAK